MLGGKTQLNKDLQQYQDDALALRRKKETAEDDQRQLRASHEQQQKAWDEEMNGIEVDYASFCNRQVCDFRSNKIGLDRKLGMRHTRAE